MSKPSPANVTARTERLVDAEWVILRRDFMQSFNAQKTTAAKARAYGGSAYREAAHGLCADELHRRVSRTLDKLLETHSAMSAPPSDKHRRACKDWIAERTAREADDLQQHIFFPLSEAGGEFVPDTLHPESQREIESANARLDSAFDQLRRNRMERTIRLCVRWGRIVGGFFRGCLGAAGDPQTLAFRDRLAFQAVVVWRASARESLLAPRRCVHDRGMLSGGPLIQWSTLSGPE